MNHYLETRTTHPTSSTAGADIARHLLSRQHLGKTVVVCSKPVIVMSVVRKAWFKLARQLQRERASTLNAEKILQLTHDITHMQHMDFAAKPPGEYPTADVFFVTPAELEQLPTNCFSLYLLAAPRIETLRSAISQLPERALVIDYTHDTAVTIAPLVSKAQLEKQLPEAWRQVEYFFQTHNIDFRILAKNIHRADRIDEAIDVILTTSNEFLRVSDNFLQLLRLCQPTLTSNLQQQMYDLLTVLNRRVYALTPGIMSQQFMQSLSDDEYSFHDAATENWALTLAV